jgi:hypothetical protein
MQKTKSFTRQARLVREAEECDRRMPVGTPVVYWLGVKDGPGRAGVIRNTFSVFGSRVVVGWVAGQASFVAASHITPRADIDGN